ncbi:hypothetical protein LTR08_001599 [Meristemomyces frigidus]|nr:hypothetical protein LTR08_001599 [Meristemomyces frigidus]
MSTTAATKAPAKSTAKATTKLSKIVVLGLAPDTLARFPSDVPPKPAATATPAAATADTSPVPPVAGESTDNNSLAPPKVDKRKRGGPPANGRKRAPPSIDPNGPMRERGRPGPKKKPRLADGTIDRTVDPTAAATNGKKHTATGQTAGARLGPKANTGNINANLRALDRTGKPCRKWHRKPLQIKSFTGTVWKLATWRAPEREVGEVKSTSADSSGMGSEERSRSGVVGGVGMESSPVPMIAA